MEEEEKILDYIFKERGQHTEYLPEQVEECEPKDDQPESKQQQKEVESSASESEQRSKKRKPAEQSSRTNEKVAFLPLRLPLLKNYKRQKKSDDEAEKN